jgi:hypothetical protein
MKKYEYFVHVSNTMPPYEFLDQFRNTFARSVWAWCAGSAGRNDYDCKATPSCKLGLAVPFRVFPCQDKKLDVVNVRAQCMIAILPDRV